MKTMVFMARPHLVFMVLALVFGGLFSVVTPPGQVPDEPFHYMRGYSIAKGKLYIGDPFLYQEQSDAYIDCMLRFKPLIGMRDAKISVDTLLKELHMPPVSAAGETVFEAYNNANIYNPLPYLMSAATVHVAAALDVPPIIGLWLARCGNLLVWTSLVMLAIAVIPVFKYELLFIALLPMSLFQGMSISADSLVNALSFLCFALVIRLLHSSPKPIERSTFVFATLVTLLVAICKQIYAWPYILLLCQKRRERAYLPLVFAGLALSILGGALWLAANKSPASPLSPEESTLARTQLQNPLEALRVVWYTYGARAEELWHGLIGVFGWLDTTLPLSAYTLYSVMFVFMVICGCEARFENEWRLRLGALAGLVIIPAILCLLLYLIWPHEGSVAGGLQGRYYMAGVPLLCVCCAKPAHWKWNPFTGIRRAVPCAYEAILVLACVAGLAVSVQTLCERYYI